MKLVSIQIEIYRSVENSEVFQVGDITCLVGKNEAGKTAILTALHQLRPYGAKEKPYDKVIDYPRRFYAEYGDRHGEEEAMSPLPNISWSIVNFPHNKQTH